MNERFGRQSRFSRKRILVNANLTHAIDSRVNRGCSLSTCLYPVINEHLAFFRLLRASATPQTTL